MRILATGPNGPAAESTRSRAPATRSCEAGRRANLGLALEQILAFARGEVPAPALNAATARSRP